MTILFWILVVMLFLDVLVKALAAFGFDTTDTSGPIHQREPLYRFIYFVILVSTSAVEVYFLFHGKP